MPLSFRALPCLPLLLAGSLLAAAPLASAQSGVSVSVQSTSTEIYAYPSGPGMITDSRSYHTSDPVSATLATGSRAASNTIIANSYGNVAGAAQIGQTQVSVVSNEYGGGGSNNLAFAQWSDTLRITSSTLPVGTATPITLTAHYIGSFTSFLGISGFPISFYSGSMQADLISSAMLDNAPAVKLNYSGASHFPAIASDPALPMDITLTQTLNARVGQTLSLLSSAQLTAIVSGQFKETVTESGNLTATFGAVPTDSAVTLGRIPAATPEPGAALFAVSGLLTGTCLLRRRKA